MSAERPRRVLILYSFGRDYAPFTATASAFKTELALQSRAPIEFHEASLETARFGAEESERPVVDYLRALFAERPLDLLVPVGGPAVRFALRHRADLFPAAPVVATGMDQRHLRGFALATNETAVAAVIDLPGVIEHILQVLPNTTNVVVVLGDSPLERFWMEEARRDFQPLTQRVEFTWLNELSFEDMRRRVAALPPHSVILYGELTVDAAGVPYERERTLDMLRAEANAPMFGLFDNQLGRGIVGGPLLSLEAIGRRAAQVALRILGGESPGQIRMPPIRAGSPVYDWRELKRWGIREADLPADSEVRFRVPTFWEQYQWELAGLIGVVVLEGVLIFSLLWQRARRRRAESEIEQQRGELAHVARVSTMGQLASALAHELNQPLGAILRNAEAAELFLRQNPPDLEELRAILADIRQDDQRAGAVIDRMRSLLKRRSLELRPLAVSGLLGEVLALVLTDAAERRVRLKTEAAPDLPLVRGDRVQLTQVLLNLVVNAMDALNGSDAAARSVTIRAGRRDGFVELAVSDTGPGIPTDRLPQVFDPFFTTKPNGLGMGLSICRTIVEAHGGSISAENNPDGGVTVRCTIPPA